MDDFQLTLTVTIFINGNFLINYVATRGPDLEPFVVGSLIQLLCPVTKFGWLDDDRFKEVIKEARNFLSQVMIFFSLFDFCLFVCFFGLVLFCFVCLFGFFFFFFFFFSSLFFNDCFQEIYTIVFFCVIFVFLLCQVVSMGLSI